MYNFVAFLFMKGPKGGRKMQPTIELEFEYAYNVWKESKEIADETIKSLKACYQRTSGKEIDKASQTYPIEFLNYIDARLRDF